MPLNSFPELGWLIGGLLLIGGLIGIIGGRRGRRVGDHPHCRRCGFDLFGKPETSTHCPECGTDVTPARAIVIGERHSDRTLVAGGVVMMLLGVLAMGSGVWSARSQVQWERYYPVSWLLTDASGTASVTRTTAWTELSRRTVNNQLGTSNRQSVIDFLLDWHGDPTKPWTIMQQQLLSQLHQSEPWSQENWDRYTRNCVRIELNTRPKVRLRSNPIAQVRVYFERSSIDMEGQITSGAIYLNEHPVSLRLLQPRPGGDSAIDVAVTKGWAGPLDLNRKEAANLGVGMHAFAYTANVVLRPRGASTPTATFQVAARKSVELIPADAGEVDREAPPELANTMDRAWVATHISRAEGGIQIQLRIAKPPLPLAMSCEIRPAGTGAWTRIGLIHKNHTNFDASPTFRCVRGEVVAASAVDVRLVPSDDSLEPTVLAPVFWGDELVREGVRVGDPAQ